MPRTRSKRVGRRRSRYIRHRGRKPVLLEEKIDVKELVVE